MTVYIQTEFEVFSHRVKAISFHPTKPLILSSLRTNCIQIWNYENGQLLHEFQSPHGNALSYGYGSTSRAIRAIQFNPNENINEFVSGGDDGIIKIWNYCNFQYINELKDIVIIFVQ